MTDRDIINPEYVALLVALYEAEMRFADNTYRAYREQDVYAITAWREAHGGR